jgi:hypothetical protein
MKSFFPTLSGCHGANHQSPFLRLSRSRPTRSMAFRKSIASRIDSSVSAGPASSIIFEDTSVEAIRLYCGEVDVYIMNDSLKSAGSTGMRPERMWIIEACESAASSLWVEWVAVTVASCGDRSPRCIP